MIIGLVRQCITTVVTPGLLLVASALQTYDSELEWSLWFLGVGALVCYSFLTGLWFLFGYYFRFVLPVAFILVAIESLLPAVAMPLVAGMGVTECVGAILFLVYLPLTVAALRGYRVPSGCIDASFPMRDGIYYVAHGGGSALINHHRPADYPSYAIDVVKLNRLGFRARSFYPRRLRAYFIFEDIVHSPVDGTVVKADDGHPDVVPPNQDRVQPAGNYVTIKHSATGALFMLMHLRCDSLYVSEGGTVHAGEPIAQVGNSGNSTEPHLHFHCEMDDSPAYNQTGTGLPLVFNGRFLRRNSLIRC